MIGIPRGLIRSIPVIGPAVGAVGLALDVKEIAESTTPVGAATVYTGGNPMVVGGTVSAFRSMIKKL